MRERPANPRGLGLSTLNYALSTKNGCQGWTRTNTERLNRPPCYFDTTWQWLIGAAGRTCTCISSFRRRMPRLFRPRQHGKWSEQQDWASQALRDGCPKSQCSLSRIVIHLRPPGPKPGALKTELRSDKMADPKGLAPSAFPQTTGCSGYLSYGSKNGGRCW